MTKITFVLTLLVLHKVHGNFTYSNHIILGDFNIHFHSDLNHHLTFKRLCAELTNLTKPKYMKTNTVLSTLDLPTITEL